MKTGKSLTALAQEIERQAESKRDFIAPTLQLQMTAPDTPDRLDRVIAHTEGVKMRVGNEEPMEIGETAHGQVAELADIPKAYYDRMRREQPGLLARNVNTWLHAKPQNRMVRTLDGRVRALLSDRYRPLDNADLAEVILPALRDAKLILASCEITERRLYIKAVDEAVQRDIERVRKGAHFGDGSHTIFDTASPAIQISNSEIGFGVLSIESGMLTKGCTNLAWFAMANMRKVHVGGRLDIGDELYAVLTDETKAKTDEAVWLQVRDTVKAALDPKVFGQRIEKVQATARNEIVTNDFAAVIEVVGKKFTMTEGQRGGVLRHLIEGGDLSQYGLFNAITRTAEDQADYDEATRFEAMGGKVIELPRHEWMAISEGRELTKREADLAKAA